MKSMLMKSILKRTSNFCATRHENIEIFHKKERYVLIKMIDRGASSSFLNKNHKVQLIE